MKNLIKIFLFSVILLFFVIVILSNPKENLILLGLMISWGIIFAPIVVYIEKKNKSI